MSVPSLGSLDLAVAASLVVLNAGLSLALNLNLHRQIAIATGRMVVQLIAIGYLLRFIFTLNDPAATLALLFVMSLIAAREVASRPENYFLRHETLLISVTSVSVTTCVTITLALATALRPNPWYDPRYAVPLTGIVLGSVMNAASLTLDGLLGAVRRERLTIEAQLGLGVSFRAATAGTFRAAVRRGLLPIINQMSAAGIITLPGIMTGQLLAGMDPVEAVKYQILLMFLLAGSSGLASLGIAHLALQRLTDDRQRLRLDRLF